MLPLGSEEMGPRTGLGRVAPFGCWRLPVYHCSRAVFGTRRCRHRRAGLTRPRPFPLAARSPPLSGRLRRSAAVPLTRNPEPRFSPCLVRPPPPGRPHLSGDPRLSLVPSAASAVQMPLSSTSGPFSTASSAASGSWGAGGASWGAGGGSRGASDASRGAGDASSSAAGASSGADGASSSAADASSGAAGASSGAAVASRRADGASSGADGGCGGGRGW